MRRQRFSFREKIELIRPFFAPTLLSVAVFVLSTLGFIFQNRNDLLIFAAQQNRFFPARVLAAMGAHATEATETFPEPAFIEYLHSLYDPRHRGPQGVAFAELLLRAGASLSERSAAGWTPMMLAAGAGQTDIVMLLIRHGADIDARGFGEENNEGMTALMAAAMHGHADIVKLLVDRGSNVHLRSRAGYTALLLAASKGHLPCVELLLQKGASVPLSTVQVAERNGHTAIAKRLREAMDQPRTEVLRRPAKFPEE